MKIFLDIFLPVKVGLPTMCQIRLLNREYLVIDSRKREGNTLVAAFHRHPVPQGLTAAAQHL